MKKMNSYVNLDDDIVIELRSGKLLGTKDIRNLPYSLQEMIRNIRNIFIYILSKLKYKR